MHLAENGSIDRSSGEKQPKSADGCRHGFPIARSNAHPDVCRSSTHVHMTGDIYEAGNPIAGGPSAIEQNRNVVEETSDEVGKITADPCAGKQEHPTNHFHFSGQGSLS